MSAKVPINWLGVTTFMLTMAGIVWAGSEKLADKASKDDVGVVERKVQATEAVQVYMREDIKEIQRDVKEILKEVRKN